MTAAAAVPKAELARRTIRRGDYVSCNQAFIDCKTPGSEKKENYSIIGPGVTQSAAQVINLQEPHGFNIGAAAMPNGVTNNLHMHFTSEVFLNFRGDWLMRWGVDGTDGEYLSHEGDIVTVPPWVFRGFTNVGVDDGWLFTVLGFDNTGGIVWGPSILAQAREYGLYLTADNKLVDTEAGDPIPPDEQLIKPMPQEEIAKLRRWSAERMRSRVVTQDDLAWSDHALLCSALSGGRAELALVIGYGMTEDRGQEPPVHYPHNFTVAWLRAGRGEGLLTHRHDHSQALTVYRGRWRITLNQGPDEVSTEVGPFDTVSVPAGAWRRFEAISGDGGQLVVVNGGDDRVRLEWAEDVRRRAAEAGFVADAAGYVAPRAVVGASVADD